MILSDPCHSYLEGGEILTGQYKSFWIKLIYTLNSGKISREISLDSLNGLSWIPAELCRSIKVWWGNINKQPWNWERHLESIIFQGVAAEFVMARHLSNVSQIQKALIWNFASSWCQRPHPCQHSCKSKCSIWAMPAFCSLDVAGNWNW